MGQLLPKYWQFLPFRLEIKYKVIEIKINLGSVIYASLRTLAPNFWGSRTRSWEYQLPKCKSGKILATIVSQSSLYPHEKWNVLEHLSPYK